jgi:hypothetical protein
MIHVLAHDLASLASITGDTISGVLAAAPDPGNGVAPPGSESLIKILQWLKWIFTALAVAGGIFIAAKMIMSHQRGDDAQVGKLGIWLGACVLAGVAPNIVDALV